MSNSCKSVLNSRNIVAICHIIHFCKIWNNVNCSVPVLCYRNFRLKKNFFSKFEIEKIYICVFETLRRFFFSRNGWITTNIVMECFHKSFIALLLCSFREIAYVCFRYLSILLLSVRLFTAG